MHWDAYFRVLVSMLWCNLLGKPLNNCENLKICMKTL